MASPEMNQSPKPYLAGVDPNNQQTEEGAEDDCD